MRRILKAYKFEFYRGDSFQVWLKNAEVALQVALLCRAAAISASPDEGTFLADIRVSIGIAKTATPRASLGAAKGEPFVLSGRAFDELVKKDTRLVITSANALANTGLQVIADHINSIFKVITSKQSEVIFELLKGSSQTEVANTLRKSKSTISQHVSSGRWGEIERLLKHFQSIINQLV